MPRMTRSALASLVVLSTETSPEAITQTLGVAPTNVVPQGSVLRSGQTQEFHVWSVDSGRLPDAPGDRTGTAALRWLLDCCRAATGKVADLPTDCEARIWWSSGSDSPDDFVVPEELAADVEALGVDIHTASSLDERA
ncbi:DUF4279 domain-containing protein [Microbacterium sp. NPDC090003]|uniref:DUF4279 domain-containing protein n=1 Tax=Microbacterium sp. NPDC090003 TaxID=3364203 RepID=UPI00380F03B2